MDLYPRQRRFEPPSNVQDDYMPTPTQPQTNSIVPEFGLQRSTSRSAASWSVAVFQAGRKPACAESKGILCRAPPQSNANHTPPMASAAITTNSPPRPTKSYHISKPSEEDLCDAANLFSRPQPG